MSRRFRNWHFSPAHYDDYCNSSLPELTLDGRTGLILMRLVNSHNSLGNTFLMEERGKSRYDAQETAAIIDALSRIAASSPPSTKVAATARPAPQFASEEVELANTALAFFKGKCRRGIALRRSV